MDLLKSTNSEKSHQFGLLYVINFIISFHLFFIVYFNSSHLKEIGFSEESLSGIYILGSAVGILGMLTFARVLRRVGCYRAALVLLSLEMFALGTLAFTQDLLISLIAFVGYLLIFPLILLSLDVFLESMTKQEGSTGSIRGIFLTVTNAALIISPLAAGFLLNGDGFSKMYLVSASFLLPVIIIVGWYFKGFSDPVYEPLRLKDVLHDFSQDRNLRNIFLAHLVLRIFYVFMVIYTPLYLHNTIGFSLSTIGIMFAIMLLPFVLFEIPLGKIADRLLGEKEIMIVGFLIAGATTLLMSLISIPAFALWTAVLFATRTGASAIEITTESYFFKHVGGKDADTISLFRTLRPLSYIIGATLGGVALLFTTIHYLFIIPAVFLFLGIIPASRIRDTK
ncbi:MAG: MFS transporter [Candidatus Pacebacteria bacterium]|nr:MFS transporter [Candidatus Paceibacterota bacterium]